MNLTRITYIGRKTYADTTALRLTWEHGDTKPVTQDAAKQLLRFAEFRKAEDVATAEGEAKAAQVPETPLAEQAVMMAIQESQAKEQDEADAKEAFLASLAAMDKAGLEATAKKYSVDLDKRKSVTELRTNVETLVHQHGVR